MAGGKTTNTISIGKQYNPGRQLRLSAAMHRHLQDQEELSICQSLLFTNPVCSPMYSLGQPVVMSKRP